MKRASAVLVLLPAILAFGLLPAHGEGKAEKVGDELKALDARITDAVRAGDGKTVGKYLADDYLVIDPLGRTHTKKSYLGYIEKDIAKFEQLKETDVQVRTFGDAAVITGLLHIKGMVKGQDVSGEYRWTRVYQKKGDDWQIIVEHQTYVHPKE
jgi:ketosteroid isomerase-like protein